MLLQHAILEASWLLLFIFILSHERTNLWFFLSAPGKAGVLLGLMNSFSDCFFYNWQSQIVKELLYKTREPNIFQIRQVLFSSVTSAFYVQELAAGVLLRALVP